MLSMPATKLWSAFCALQRTAFCVPIRAKQAIIMCFVITVETSAWKKTRKQNTICILLCNMSSVIMILWGRRWQIKSQLSAQRSELNNVSIWYSTPCLWKWDAEIGARRDAKCDPGFSCITLKPTLVSMSFSHMTRIYDWEFVALYVYILRPSWLFQQNKPVSLLFHSSVHISIFHGDFSEILNNCHFLYAILHTLLFYVKLTHCIDISCWITIACFHKKTVCSVVIVRQWTSNVSHMSFLSSNCMFTTVASSKRVFCLKHFLLRNVFYLFLLIGLTIGLTKIFQHAVLKPECWYVEQFEV